MEDIIIKTEPKYTIVRSKGYGNEYFCKAKIHGIDKNGVLRISNIKWEKVNKWEKAYIPYDVMYMYSLNEIKDILNGMQKSGEIEKEYIYAIAEVQTTTAIVEYIE